MRLISQVFLLLCLPLSAQAYIGPGAGISAIGSAIALVAVIILFFVGFLWYPIKRAMQRRKPDVNDDIAETRDERQSSDESSGLS